MSQQSFVIVGLGETLWDALPEGMQLGGAPANFAYVSALLGDEAIVASRIGLDLPGHDIIIRFEKLGLTTTHLQRDASHATGTAEASLNHRGEATFTITENVAWDYFEWTSQWEELAKRADAVCFGSLAQRSLSSRETIRRFLRATRPATLRIFDVNMRGDFYSNETLSESLKLAAVVKVNRAELARVVELLKLGGRGETAWAHRLIQVFDLKMVCVTRGAQGSLLVTDTEILEHPGFTAQVADTVGAGDAFTASLVHHLLRGASPEEACAAANLAGAWMASQKGATPPVEPGQLTEALTKLKASAADAA